MPDSMSRYDIIHEIQNHCADLAELKTWDTRDGEYIAELFNKDDDPWGLFRLMDEKTGSPGIGYKTRDGTDREWFHILRQMRNQPGSGLLENLKRKTSDDGA